MSQAVLRALSVQPAGDGANHAPRDIFNPTEEHRQLRDMVRAFAEKEVDPQALAFNRREEVGLSLRVHHHHPCLSAMMKGLQSTAHAFLLRISWPAPC